MILASIYRVCEGEMVYIAAYTDDIALSAEVKSYYDVMQAIAKYFLYRGHGKTS